MVFSRALTEKVPSSLNEGRRKSTRMISHDDHAFNFIYLIKMKDYIVKTTRSLRAEWVRAIENFVHMMPSSKCRPGTILENLYSPQNFVPLFCIRLFGPLSPSSPERGQTELPFKAITNGVGWNVPKKCAFEVELWHLNWARKGWHATKQKEIWGR